MPEHHTLEDFYRVKANWMPENLRQDIGHFNVFRLDDFVGPAAQSLPYSRKDFYKINFVVGQSTYHYADKSVVIEDNALLFANPLVPYDWEPRNEQQSGFFCIFTEHFLQQHGGLKPTNFSVFQPDGQPIYFLTDAQQAHVRQLFQKMFAELDSDYVYKYDLLRGYVWELIHSAMKLQPATTLYRESNAATRIASLFTELLARQFPIEVQGQRVKLRTAQDFAHQLAVHTNHLNRALKEVTGKTTTQLLAERLVQEAQALLKHTDWPVGLIGYGLGFEEPAHFNNFFKKHTGQTPTAVRAV
ncbi:helix-turn-helix domain-containing protein [Hymenobacter nivis]|uniref:AraC family transcriptional regulator n=1 Tax=Hymenobacter nivis TaxID=1850093 RepID=A0A502GNA5_9BACT|nr:helix-turn-helix domain-containing protein [Hymenobacter nivis]TPG62373.1 AraC family transcriptional regulator [Hymenobacter nivis]